MGNRKELLLILIAGTVLFLLAGAANGNAQRHALRCQQSLHEIYRLANCYSADNGGYIVRSLVTHPIKPAVFWPDRLKVYARDFLDFSCPANAKRGARAFVKDDLLPTHYVRNFVSFGINDHISGGDRKNAPIEKIDNVKNPDYLVYFGDSYDLRLSSATKFWLKNYAPVHDNAMQAVMADGHLETFHQGNLGIFGKIPGWKQDTARWKNWKQRIK